MIRLIVLCLAFVGVFFVNKGTPETLDSQYYPQRLEWHHVEQFEVDGEQTFIQWDEGRYLRVRTSDEPVDLSVWYSLGDGLFQQMQPVNQDQSRLLFKRPKNQPLLIMLDGSNQQTGNSQPFNVDIGKYRKAPKLSVLSDRILHPDNQVKTNHSGGYASQRFNQITPAKGLEYVLEGPAEYSFVMRSQWMPKYGQSQLMELQLTLEQQPTQTEVIKIQPQTNHLLQTDWCECIYSRPEQVRMTIPDGTHIVTVKTDRDILGYWTVADGLDPFFYQSNAKLAFSGQLSEPSDWQDFSNTGLDDVPAQYFYRELSPDAQHIFTSAKPLATSVLGELFLNERNNKHWSAFRDLDAIDPLYFAQIGAGQSSAYNLPTTSHQPPLRLYLKTGENEQLDKADFSLLSDANETVRFRYLPDHKFKQSLTIEDFDKVAAQFIEFDQPFTSVLLTNNSQYPLQTHLGYKNRSRHKTDEMGFMSQLDIDTANTVIDKLIGQPGQIESVLLSEEIRQWQKRLRSRYQSLLQQYPLSTEQDRSSLAKDVDTVMAKLGVSDIEQLIQVLDSKGMAAKAKKLLGAFTMQANPEARWQRQTQKLWLDRLSAQERWFDIEGYWAYRLIKYQEKSAVVPLAQVLFRQNRFEQASKWFWLAYKGGLLDTVPDEAIVTAYIGGYEKLLSQWFKLHKRKLSPYWHYWQPIDLTQLGLSARELIHNKGLDSYFTATKLSAGQSQSLDLTGPLRIKLTLYPQSNEPTWLTLKSNRHQRRYLLDNLHDSFNLVSATDDINVLGSPKSIIVDLFDDEQLQSVALDEHSALFTVHQLRGGANGNYRDQRPATPVLLSDEALLNPVSIVSNDDKVDAILLQAIQHKQTLPIETVSAINALLSKNTASATQLNWLGRINQDHGWQRLQTVISSAGEKTFGGDTWQPASDYMRLQKALMTGPVNPGERMLSYTNAQVIELQTLQPKSLVLGMRQMHRLGEVPGPVMININHNETSQSLTLSAEKGLRLPLSLLPGNHQIRVSFAKDSPYANKPWVCFSLSDQQKSSVLPPMQRKYHASTARNPLVVFVPDSTWLRIDELDEQGQLTSTNRYVASAQKLTLKPSKSTTSNEAVSSYYRVYHWQPNKLKSIEKPKPVSVPELIAIKREPVQHTYWLPGNNDAFEMYDKYPVAQQEDGTWGLFSGYKARRNFDEDEQTSREQFYQTGWRYQLNMPEWDSHFSTSLSMRDHLNTNLQTLVSENDGIWRLNKFWDFSTKLNAYYQYRANDPAIEGAWSLYASSSARWKQYSNDNLDNKVIMTIFARALSLSEAQVHPQQASATEVQGDNGLMFEDGFGVDDDVYSDYKEDNLWGLKVADTLQYTPWIDTKLRLHVALTSDKYGNFFKPHKYLVAAGIRQYWQPFILKLDLQHSRFYRDREDVDSTGSLSRTAFRLGVGWEQWSGSGQLWQIDTFVNKDLNGGGTSFGLNFYWDLSHGQGFDDFAPNQLLFGDLRRRDSFNVIESNQVASDSHD